MSVSLVANEKVFVRAGFVVFSGHVRHFFLPTVSNTTSLLNVHLGEQKGSRLCIQAAGGSPRRWKIYSVASLTAEIVFEPLEACRATRELLALLLL